VHGKCIAIGQFCIEADSVSTDTRDH
jgi:hypothetical protein